MLDFRRHQRVRTFGNAGLERRLLTLLVGSAIVIFLIVGARNPGAWHWLAPPAPPRNGAGAGAPHEPNTAEDVHHLVIASNETTSPENRADDQAGEPTAGAGAEAAQAASGETGEKRNEFQQEHLFPGVRPDYLAAARDDTVFRPEESDAWFHLFAVVERAPEGELAHASLGPVGYLQLSQQPREYRGRVVTVSGIARAAKRVAAPQNAFGVKEYYQVWLQPDRASPELLVVYCAQLPQGFPWSAQMAEECSAAAIFFKRWAYQSQGGITTAPLLVAKTLEWLPAAAPAQQPAQPLGEQLATAVVLALILSALVVVFLARRGSSRQSVAHEPGTNVGAALSTLVEEPRDQRSIE